MGVRQRHALALLLGWWALAGLVLNLLAGGWQPLDLTLPAVPLALLAGLFLGRLFESMGEEPLGEAEWLLIGVMIPLAVYSFVEFTVYARGGKSPYLLAFGGSALIYLLVAGLMVFWGGWRRALRGVALAVALLGAALLISNCWSANFNFDLARRDLFTAERTDGDLRTLVGTVARYSAQTLRDTRAAPILVVGETLAWLRWELRDFRDVTFVGAFDTAERRTVVLSPAGVEPRLGDLFSGQAMQVRSGWKPAGMSGQARAKWLLYREPAEPPQAQKMILWVQRTLTP